jgi:DHA1 family inner membrane transport protein
MILIAALLFAVFASAIIDVVLPITTMDIATTFNVPIGTVGQLDSLNAIATVVTALLVGAFGSRFRYKTLVLTGVVFIAFCATGLYLTPTFPLAQVVFPLNGIGSVLIIVTTQTFIGNYYPLDKRAKAIGWVAATSTLANAVGSPIIGFMTGIGGWRSVLIWFMLPIALISLIFVFVIFPFKLPELQLKTKKEPFMKGFKQVLTNKSAVACLFSAFLINAAVFGGMVFEVTFYREIFSVTPTLAALIGPTAGTALITVGAVIGGQIVNRVGRKRLTLITVPIASSLTILSYFVPGLWTRVALRLTASLIGGASVAAFANLTIEQVPEFKGTTMALSSAFIGVGTAVGIAVAGTMLNLYASPTAGFQALGLVMGGLSFVMVLVTLFFARDPIKKEQPTMVPPQA